MRTLLEKQYEALASWLDDIPVSAHLAAPVGLGSWTVRDLVAHLGLGIGLSRFLTTASTDAVPLSFGQYVRHYPPNAEQIDQQTQEISAQMTASWGDDLVAGFRRVAEESFAALDATPGMVLQARRGPIRRDDYLLTRLLELVVHGDDLQSALGRADAPLLASAVEELERVLAEAYREVAGRDPASRGMAWIREASGRMSSEDPHLPLL